MSSDSNLERDLARHLRRNHGVISRAEAISLGTPDISIRARLRRGEWERVLPGIYRAASSPRGHHQDLRAASLSSGGVGAIESASFMLGLQRQPPDLPDVLILHGRNARRRPTSYRLHVSRDLGINDTTIRDNLRITTPMRTLIDLAGAVPPSKLSEAVDQAFARKMVRIQDLERELDRLSKQGRTGVGALRQFLSVQGFAGAPQPSVLEAHARRLVRSLALPDPQVELHVGRDNQYRLDIAWLAVLLAVEIDGYAWHFSPAHKRRDEQRRQQLRAAGWTILVFDWQQVLTTPDLVATEICSTYGRLLIVARHS